MKRIALLRLLTITVVFCSRCLSAGAEDYNPLAIADDFKPATLDLTVQDKARDRDIPLKVYLPASRVAEPVVLFSHGLGANREGSSFLGRHWAARGYVAVFLQHSGSDDALWKSDGTLRERLQAFKAAANARNFVLRVQDVSSVLDQLETWNKADGHGLQSRLDLKKVGMSGHSFGALTTQAVGGQKFRGGRNSGIDDRVIAALPMSPSIPEGEAAKEAFSSVGIPWMLMTGTNDTDPFGNNSDATSRLGVFPALPPGDKYELVLFEAEHLAFTDIAPRRRRAKPRNPNHHHVILALSTAFWDVHLRSNTAAETWLHGSGPRTVLQKDDRWQKK